MEIWLVTIIVWLAIVFCVFFSKELFGKSMKEIFGVETSKKKLKENEQKERR